MYCSSCGAAMAQGLNYCKRCGAKLSRATSEGIPNPPELFPESLVWAIVTVFVVGLGATIGLMAVMKNVLALSDGPIMLFSLLSFLLMIAIEGIFIWLLLRGKQHGKEAGDTERLKEQAINELGEARGRVLHEPAPSVIEHTTHALEPAQSKQPKIQE